MSSRSVFYEDATIALTSFSNTADLMDEREDQRETLLEGKVEILIDKIEQLPPGCETKLFLCKASCGGHVDSTRMYQPEEADPTTVQFNQLMPFDVQLKSREGVYTPRVQYLVLDIYIHHNDKNKADEFLGRVMIPVLHITPKKTEFVVSAGSVKDRPVEHHPVVTCTVQLACTGFTGWHGTHPTQLQSNFQYKIMLNGTVTDFPGAYERVELCVSGVTVEMCEEVFPADVYLTNFRVLVLASNDEHRRFTNWMTFPNILGIEKSYIQTTASHRKCCYTIRCYDCRAIKVMVPTATRIKRIKKEIEQRFHPKSQDSDKVVLEMSTPRLLQPASAPTRHATITSFLVDDNNICSSDGEAKDGDTEGDDILGDGLYSDDTSTEKLAADLYNNDVNSIGQLDYPEDEYSDDDFLGGGPIPAVRITGDSDGDSLDSLDFLGVEEPRGRLLTGTSVSSFTSYIIKSARSKDRPKEVRHGLFKKKYHDSKIQMESLRLRVCYHHLNPDVGLPCHYLLNHIPVEQRRGFRRYNIDKEHNRQGDMKDWTKVDNTAYNLCKSYPPLFYVPIKASVPTILSSVLNFRSKGRIPALCWLNDSGAILLRSAQPKTGILQKNCKEDQLFMSIVRILSSTRRNTNKDLPFMIFDARSKIAASGNKMKGKGTENIHHYDSTKLSYLDMGNIHAIRDSYEKLTSISNLACSAKWLSRLEQSQWLVHVQGMLRGAFFISQHLGASGAALVHCSDGWDRTSQLTCLSLILLDPFYRTYRGFQVLVEREWLSFGHRFHDRLGLAHPNQKSPIFLLFLDGVHQIVAQFPNVFEFLGEYLVVLADLFSSGWTTTFLRNCVMERSSTNVIQIWDILDGMQKDLSNDRYYLHSQPLVPKVSLRNMVVWREYFLRYDWWGEALAEDRVGPVVWVPDENVDQCHLCHEKFSAIKFIRKHHCRSCGNIFCGNCAKSRICIPEKNYMTPVLVCDKCYEEHTRSC